MFLCCRWDNKVFTFQIAKYFAVGFLKLRTLYKNVEALLWFVISHRRQWPKADLAETSELHDKPLLNFSRKNFIIFTVFGGNELILLLLQKFVYLLNVLLYFVLVVFFHAADIIACASNENDVVDKPNSRLLRPTSEVSDRVDVTLGSNNFEVLTGNDCRWWVCKFHDPWSIL